MSANDSDSMWLQRSITIPDSIPETNAECVSESVPQGAATEETAAPSTTEPLPAQPLKQVVEMDLTKMVLDTSALVAHSQRPSSARYSVRASVSNAAFISAQEYDDLRSRLSQAKRELLKLSDVQRSLEFANFELTRAKEELKLERQSNVSVKKDLEDAVDRAEVERKARVALQAKVQAEDALRAEEVDFLKTQLEQLRQENMKRLSEMTEQQEREYQTAIQALRDELANAVDGADAVNESLATMQTERDVAVSKFQSSQTELEGARASISDLQAKFESQIEQYKELAAEHRSFVSQCEKEHEEELADQLARNEERVQQIISSKEVCITELKDEVQQLKGRNRAMASDLAALRHTSGQLEEEMRQIGADHAKEMRRAAEEHRLALCEKQMQHEASVREAKGSKNSIEEENQSLRRQHAKVAEELSTVAAVLAQRERQVNHLEKDNGIIKDSLHRLELENAQLVSDVEAHCGSLEEANERIHRIIEQKDSLEEEFTEDLRQAKERVRALETTVMEQQGELSALRRECIKADDDERMLSRKLRAELDSACAERTSLAQSLARMEKEALAASELRRLHNCEKEKVSTLTSELNTFVDRCTTLERRLNEELRHRVAEARVSPGGPPSRSPTGSGQRGLRSVSSVNIRNQSSSLKRARTEDARVLAITGFDGNELFMAIKQLPNVAIADCKSNMAVPSNLTHLISNGQMTIKLLTALARGCWVLPETYVLDSLQQRVWLPESDYGFQHAEPPLLKKRVAVTEAFMSSKHHVTAKLILKEGGAILEENPEAADIVLCVNSEASSYGANAINWEKMVEKIYPVRIH